MIFRIVLGRSDDVYTLYTCCQWLVGIMISSPFLRC